MEKLSFPQLPQNKFSFKKYKFITSPEDWCDADDGTQFEDIMLTPQSADIEKPEPKNDSFIKRIFKTCMSSGTYYNL
tara:strand:+ start:1154 stop:1384 length:231 start_codon:yes stop_codon:yes gene_type:complete